MSSLDPGSNQASTGLRRAAGVVACGLCVTAAVAIWALLVGRFDEGSVRILLSALAVALFTLTGLAGATILGGGRRVLGQLTIASSISAAVLVLWQVWVADGSGALWEHATGITITLAVAGAHASLLLARLREHDPRAAVLFTRAATAASAAAALVIICLLAFASGPIDGGVWRLIGVLVVLALLNTLLAPLARKIGGGGGSSRPSPGAAAARSRPRAAASNRGRGRPSPTDPLRTSRSAPASG
jgi:hypothetical protein